MRSRIPLFALVLIAGSFLFPYVAHAGIPFFGPIVPSAYNVCAAGWGMLIMVINNLISFLLTFAIVFIAPLMIAYAGFLFVVNPVNSAGIGKAKDILTNTIVGIVIALAGYLIVDALMAVLYNPSAAGATWKSLVSGGGDICLPQAGSLPSDTLNQATVTGVTATGGKFLALPTSGLCAASNLLAATAGSQYQLTQSQANTLSCIAVPESSCGTNITGAKQVNGTPTSAGGMFQIVMGYNDTCHNLNIPSCTAAAQAAGYSINGNLNCSTAFSRGSPKPGMESLAAACRAATANLNCNAQAAACLVKASGGKFTDWTSDPRSSTQQNCITQYANK